VLEAVVAPLERDVLLGQEPAHGLHDLVRPPAALLRAGAGDLELGRVPPGPDPEQEPPVGEVVQRRDLLREQHRIPQREDEDPGAQLRVLGHPGRVREDAHRLQPRHAVQPFGVEQVVDHPDVVARLFDPADVVAQPARVDRVAVRVRVGGDPDAELHRPIVTAGNQ
jgi:hypothetical protein